MNQWWRAYNEAVNDPKLQLLSDVLFRAWFNLMCIASGNDGSLPALNDLAFTLRMKPEKVGQVLTKLYAAGLLDKTETGFTPHNWNGRQYKSDVSTDRVKRFRNNKRNVSSAVSETPPETEQIQNTETEQKTEANASGAVAPVDHRKRLFDEGLSKLAKLTGKGPDACRSFVGKCLKAAGDDAVTVLGLIEDAERNRVVDPSAWISKRLKSTGPPPVQRLTPHQQDRHEMKDILNGLDNFASGGSGSSQADTRLLLDNSSERPGRIRSGAGSDADDLPARSYQTSS